MSARDVRLFGVPFPMRKRVRPELQHHCHTRSVPTHIFITFPSLSSQRIEFCALRLSSSPRSSSATVDIFRRHIETYSKTSCRIAAVSWRFSHLWRLELHQSLNNLAEEETSPSYRLLLLLEQRLAGGRPSDAESQGQLSPLPPHHTLVHIRPRILTAAFSCLPYSCEQILENSLCQLTVSQKSPA